MVSAGLAVPLLIVYACLTFVALLLLAPRPLCSPAIALARVSRTPHGSLVLYTLCAVLTLLLASPIVEMSMLSGVEHTKERNEQEARTTLAGVLILSILLLLFVLRRLGTLMGEVDRKRLSEAALLKQVAGLRQEYDRLTSTTTLDTNTSTKQQGDNALAAKCTALEQQVAQLQISTDAAVKAKNAAEANAAALKSQARGLENEYDRLLASFDALQVQLSRVGVGEGVGEGGGGGWAAKKGA